MVGGFVDGISNLVGYLMPNHVFGIYNFKCYFHMYWHRNDFYQFGRNNFYVRFFINFLFINEMVEIMSCILIYWLKWFSLTSCILINLVEIIFINIMYYQTHRNSFL